MQPKVWNQQSWQNSCRSPLTFSMFFWDLGTRSVDHWSILLLSSRSWRVRLLYASRCQRGGHRVDVETMEISPVPARQNDEKTRENQGSRGNNWNYLDTNLLYNKLVPLEMAMFLQWWILARLETAPHMPVSIRMGHVLRKSSPQGSFLIVRYCLYGLMNFLWVDNPSRLNMDQHGICTGQDQDSLWRGATRWGAQLGTKQLSGIHWVYLYKYY